MTEKYPRFSGEDVLAHCAGCKGDLRTFKRHWSGQLEGPYLLLPNPPDGSFYSFHKRTIHTLFACSTCARVAYVKWDQKTRSPMLGGQPTEIERSLLDFYPRTLPFEHLPDRVPREVVLGLNEGARCQQEGLYRAAGALYRATLEQLLKLNGYGKEHTLFKRIEAAYDEKLITLHLRKRADMLRAAGNDILHDLDTIDEVKVGHLRRFLHSLISEFYEHRDSVEEELRKVGRI